MKFTVHFLLISLLISGCAYVPVHEAPRTSWVALVRPMGTSMGPNAPRQVLADFGFPYSRLKAGDTVIRWAAGERLYVHHRLVRRVPVLGAWVTQGDANAVPDAELLRRRDYVAKTSSMDPERP
jgi:hypothetical protein